MDEQEQNRAAQAGPQHPPAAESPTAAAEMLEELRKKKNEEYLRAALQNNDPLLAAAGMMNADLLFYAGEIRRLMGERLKASRQAEEVAGVFPVLDAALRVYRQSERFSVFIERLSRQEEG